MPNSAREIENLIYLYAERIDAGDFSGVADLFAHGRIAATPDAPPDHQIFGRDAVLEMYRSTTRIYEDTATPKTRHMTSNVIIEVDDDAETAAARSYFTVLQSTETLALQPIITGRYHDSFHRVDKAWCFDLRIMIVDAMGDLTQHLLIDLT